MPQTVQQTKSYNCLDLFINFATRKPIIVAVKGLVHGFGLGSLVSPMFHHNELELSLGINSKNGGYFVVLKEKQVFHKLIISDTSKGRGEKMCMDCSIIRTLLIKMLKFWMADVSLKNNNDSIGHKIDFWYIQEYNLMEGQPKIHVK